MNAQEYRDAISKLGWSQLAAGRVLGAGSDRTAQAWALGESRIPKSVEKLLNAILDGSLDPNDLR